MSRTINQITETERIKYEVQIEDGNGAAHIPMSIGQEKGQLIGFSGSGAPVVVPKGADGSMLIADSTQQTGVRWSIGGTNSAIELKNNSGGLIEAGTICYWDYSASSILAATKNISAERILVALQDVNADSYGLFVGRVNRASVLCLAGTYNVGDEIVVSDTAGVGKVYTHYDGEGTYESIGYVIADTELLTRGVVSILMLTKDNHDKADGEYWVDSANGDDANTGTEALPFKTVNKALAKIGGRGTIHMKENDALSPYDGFTISGKRLTIYTKNIYVTGLIEINDRSDVAFIPEKSDPADELQITLNDLNNSGCVLDVDDMSNVRFGDYLLVTCAGTGVGNLVSVKRYSSLIGYEVPTWDVSATIADGVGIYSEGLSHASFSVVSSTTSIAGTKLLYANAGAVITIQSATTSGTLYTTVAGGRIYGANQNNPPRY